MLGNVLDNAWKWAASRVDISSQSDADWLTVLIDDDGPGLPPERRGSCSGAGVRGRARTWQWPGAGDRQ